jgi:hypothetical protein
VQASRQQLVERHRETQQNRLSEEKILVKHWKIRDRSIDEMDAQENRDYKKVCWDLAQYHLKQAEEKHAERDERARQEKAEDEQARRVQELRTQGLLSWAEEATSQMRAGGFDIRGMLKAKSAIRL